jgi:DNA-binding transcriptional ArsR family regulator
MCDKRADVMYLDRDQLRLLSDPIRQRVLKLLGVEAMSTSQLAAELGDDAPGNLYYHVHRLHSAGLIRLVRTEPRRGAVEKFYEPVAKVFTVKPELVVTMAGDEPLLDDMTTAVRRMMEDTLHQFATSLARGLFSDAMDRIPPTLSGISIRAPEDRLHELAERLRRWVLDVSQEEEDVEGSEYAGFVMFFPTELAATPDVAPSKDSDGE